MFDPAESHHLLYARAGGGMGDPNARPPVYKAVGISLAVASGLFIGVSFVLKKVGLLKANAKYNEEAGEGYGYLKNAYWWGGMILMIIGEIFNFVAYAFVDAILVTPLGALSVVVTTVLSAIFLKERLSFVGKVGCLNCIIGSVVIAMHAPSQSAVSNIQGMKDYVVAPGFLSFAGVIIACCVFLALWAGPRYGKRNMFVYITICSLIGGLSVVATQGLGAAVIAQIGGQSQFNQWFLYVLLVFVIGTLLTEIIYLNKALNIFNAALVTPTYYVCFTSSTIVTSAVLFRGFRGSAISITTIVMGFLVICTGVVLLQLSKSAKDVPDAAVFKGDLDQLREVAEQEEPETEPKADAIRGTAAIIRRISSARQKMEAEELRRYHEEKMLDETTQPGENEIIQWDGLRRRRTIIGDGPGASPRRMKSVHPPLGMSRFPDFDDDPDHAQQRPQTGESRGSFFGGGRSHSSSLHPHWKPSNSHLDRHAGQGDIEKSQGLLEPFPCFDDKDGNRDRSNTNHTNRTISWADSVKDSNNHSPQSHTSVPPTPPPHGHGLSHRQFSFGKIFAPRSARSSASEVSPERESGKKLRHERRIVGLPSPFGKAQRRAKGHTTEEESLGLVKNDGGPEDGDAQHHDPSRRSESPDAHPRSDRATAPHSSAHVHHQHHRLSRQLERDEEEEEEEEEAENTGPTLSTTFSQSLPSLPTPSRPTTRHQQSDPAVPETSTIRPIRALSSVTPSQHQPDQNQRNDEDTSDAGTGPGPA